MSHEGLGTLEFAATLNGDDTKKIKEILQRFIKQVRTERKKAFCHKTTDCSIDDGFDEDSSTTDTDREDATAHQPKKKFKVEAWKLDAKSYNVPFVGTSVHRGDTGYVEEGCWPTGFLEAYLKKSPRAAELLGSDFQRVLSTASPKLKTVVIAAIAELITSALSAEQVNSLEKMSHFHNNHGFLREYTQVEPFRQHIVSIIMKEHLNKFFDILNENANSGTNQRLVVGALTCLRYLVKTSVGTAREITRGMDRFLKESTLKQLATCSLSKTKLKQKKKHVEELSEKDEDWDVEKKRMALKVKSAVLLLASSLLEYYDPSITSSIMSDGGGNDGTLKIGIAFLALRTALDQAKEFVRQKDLSTNVLPKQSFKMLQSIYNLLHLVKVLVYNTRHDELDDENRARIKNETVLSNRAMVSSTQRRCIDYKVSTS
jgi:hypothetical protein